MYPNGPLLSSRFPELSVHVFQVRYIKSTSTLSSFFARSTEGGLCEKKNYIYPTDLHTIKGVKAKSARPKNNRTMHICVVKNRGDVWVADYK
jgi:hypothetical protein